VEGRVTSASGKGIENAVIEDRGRKTETDTDGYFQLVVTRKNWNLNVSSDAYASVSTNGVFNYKHHAQVQVSLAPNAIAPGAALWAPIAKKWLSLLDQEAYSKSWLETSAQFRDEVASITWEKQMDSIRRPVGNLTSRFFISADEEDNLAGAQKGRYAIIQFQSSFVKKNSVDPNVHVMTPPNVDQSSLFESKRDAIESVTLELEKDGVWRVSGYFIK